MDLDLLSIFLFPQLVFWKAFARCPLNAVTNYFLILRRPDLIALRSRRWQAQEPLMASSGAADGRLSQAPAARNAQLWVGPPAECATVSRPSGASQGRQNTFVWRIDDGVASSFGAIPLQRTSSTQNVPAVVVAPAESARPGQPTQNVPACAVVVAPAVVVAARPLVDGSTDSWWNRHPKHTRLSAKNTYIYIGNMVVIFIYINKHWFIHGHWGCNNSLVTNRNY